MQDGKQEEVSTASVTRSEFPSKKLAEGVTTELSQRESSSITNT